MKGAVPSWAKDPWNGDSYSTCSECGDFYEIVRPGKSQPTCDCHMICPEHGIRYEYRITPAGHKGGGIFGVVCPECWPPCECEACDASQANGPAKQDALKSGPA